MKTWRENKSLDIWPIMLSPDRLAIVSEVCKW